MPRRERCCTGQRLLLRICTDAQHHYPVHIVKESKTPPFGGVFASEANGRRSPFRGICLNLVYFVYGVHLCVFCDRLTAKSIYIHYLLIKRKC